MAKDYFQDIVPPGDSGAPRPIPIRTAASEPAHDIPEPKETVPPEVEANRSIRNVNIEPRGRRPEPTEDPLSIPQPRRPRSGISRIVIWVIAILAVLALGVIALFFFRKTSVTVVPRSQTVTFDQNSQYTAYPIATAATGTLPYSVATLDLSDSEPIQSSGTEHADVKATGNITVYNDYSASPVKLLKNTRFATPDGLIFRVPDQVVIPGKSGSTPGQVTVTVQADQAGANYNIGPIAKLSLPGLQSNPAMYNNIYAKSSAAFTGGFSGDRPAAAPGAMDAAIAAVRGRLETQARAAALSSATSTVLSDLVQITYQDDPQTTEAGGGVRIHETAHVQIPEIANTDLANTIAAGIATDTAGASLSFVPGQGFAIHTSAASSTMLGVDPLQLSIAGAAQIVWNVDVNALTQALAGKSSGAFQTIIQGFPGIQEANARIEPFWKGTFPDKPSDITVILSSPKPAK